LIAPKKSRKRYLLTTAKAVEVRGPRPDGRAMYEIKKEGEKGALQEERNCVIGTCQEKVRWLLFLRELTRAITEQLPLKEAGRRKRYPSSSK